MASQMIYIYEVTPKTKKKGNNLRFWSPLQYHNTDLKFINGLSLMVAHIVVRLHDGIGSLLKVLNLLRKNSDVC